MDNDQIIQALNSVQALPELKQPANGDELNLSRAIGKVQIRNSTNNVLKEVLRLVMVKVGLRSQNWPSEEEKTVLIDHINQNFGGHTLEEIKLAFDMAIAGKLETTNSKGETITLDANCYENFSCLYFSNIMNAYRGWAKEVYPHLPKKEVPLIEDKKGITDQEMQDWVEEWKTKKFENPMMIPPVFYDWLDKKGLLNLTKEQKLDYLTVQAVTVRQYYLLKLAKSEGEHGQAQKDLTEFTRMRNQGYFTGKEIDRLKELAKKIAVYDYLKPEDANEAQTSETKPAP